MGVPPRARRKLLDPAIRQPSEVACRALERRENGPAGLVRERDRHLGPAGKRFEQGPFRSGQILKAVGVDRPAVPGGKLSGEPLRRAAALELALPEPEAVELGAVL